MGNYICLNSLGIYLNQLNYILIEKIIINTTTISEKL